jgi:hypothetical protein
MRRYVMSMGLGLAAVLSACGPMEIEGPVRVAVLDLHEGSERWSIRPATLDSLESLEALHGEAATMIGGAKIVVDMDEIYADYISGRIETIDDIRDTVLKRKGRAPRLQFTRTEVDGEPGVLLPLDYHGLALVSAYHQLESARKLALDLGMPARCLRAITTYYEVIFEMGSAVDREAMRTNAGFYPLLHAFILVPYDLDALPVGMNPGVIGHEYGHGLWSCLVDDEQLGGPTLFLDAVSQRHLRSLDEGLADFFGGLLTGETDYIQASIPGMTGRDMAVERLYTSAMTEEAEQAEYHDPYAAGAVVASALWRVAETSDDAAAIGRAVLAALSALEDRIIAHVASERRLDLTDYLDLLVQAIAVEAPADRAQACAVFSHRFAAAGSIPACA